MADADDFDVEALRALLRGGVPQATDRASGTPAAKQPAQPATKPKARRGAGASRPAKPAAKKRGRARGSGGGG